MNARDPSGLPSKKGRFLSLEGPEGGGKTTQSRRLIAALESRGIPCLYTREPGGTALGEAIRGLLQHDDAGDAPCPESETLLFSASRAQLVRHVIRPALDAGRWVICDRFADSTTAYQGYGRGFDIDTLLHLHRFALGENWPDLTLLLDIDIEGGFRRLATRHAGQGGGPDRMEREDRTFHERVRNGYLQLAARQPERYRIIDAAGHEDQVAEQILREVIHAFRLAH